MARGLGCSMACGIFLDQGSSSYSLYWQVDSYPPCHQGSPRGCLLATDSTFGSSGNNRFEKEEVREGESLQPRRGWRVGLRYSPVSEEEHFCQGSGRDVLSESSDARRLPRKALEQSRKERVGPGLECCLCQLEAVRSRAGFSTLSLSFLFVKGVSNTAFSLNCCGSSFIAFMVFCLKSALFCLKFYPASHALKPMTIGSF